MAMTMLDLSFPVFEATDTTERKLEKLLEYERQMKDQLEWALAHINGSNFSKTLSSEDQLTVAQALGGTETLGDLEKGYVYIKRDVDGVKQEVYRKAQVFTGSSLPTPPYDLGDLWAQGDSGDMKLCATARAEGETASGGDWVASSNYGDGATIVSRINQTASSVLIQAQHIDLNGVVTANEHFKINQDGSVETNKITIEVTEGATLSDVLFQILGNYYQGGELVRGNVLNVFSTVDGDNAPEILFKGAMVGSSETPAGTIQFYDEKINFQADSIDLLPGPHAEINGYQLAFWKPSGAANPTIPAVSMAVTRLGVASMKINEEPVICGQSGMATHNYGPSYRSGGVSSTNVEFPTAFAAAPSAVILGQQFNNVNMNVSNITASGFTILVPDEFSSNGSKSVPWLAIV